MKCERQEDEQDLDGHQQRAEGVDPINLLQIDLLQRWRDSERSDAAILAALFATVNGVAQGIQNTG